MAQWSGKTIGPLIGYKIFIYSIKIFGIGAAYLLLQLVTRYYFWFKSSTRNILVDFYKTALGVSHKEALKLAKENFRIFGQTLVDRAAFQMGKGDYFSYTFKNEPYLIDLTTNGVGGVLMSAHLGNWETAGNLVKKRITGKVNALIMDAEVEKIKQFMNKSTGGSHFNIIPIKNDLSHIIRIKNALSDNELIAIHADRIMEGARYIECKFFNRQVKFPYGPFQIASRLKVPITFVYAVKSGKRSYALSATEPVITTESPEFIAQAYASELERMVIKYPEQWFNYYNYFNQ